MSGDNIKGVCCSDSGSDGVAIRLRSMGETVSMFIENHHVENTLVCHNAVWYIIIAHQSMLFPIELISPPLAMKRHRAIFFEGILYWKSASPYQIKKICASILWKDNKFVEVSSRLDLNVNFCTEVNIQI